jgi:hypothetical protein
MSLKPDRSYLGNQVDVSYFMNTTGEAGIIVVHDTSVTGSGAAMDDPGNVVKIAGVSGGQGSSGTRPAGVLLNDVVNYDLTRQHINYHRDEVQIGSKVQLLRGGPGAWITTNQISGVVLPGQKAYYTELGKFTATALAGVDQVGRFGSAVDVDGYAKVFVNIV